MRRPTVVVSADADDAMVVQPCNLAGTVIDGEAAPDHALSLGAIVKQLQMIGDQTGRERAAVSGMGRDPPAQLTNLLYPPLLLTFNMTIALHARSCHKYLVDRR